MDLKEKAVREAAAKLASAIADARAAGFEIGWPRTVEGLGTLTISATGKVKSPARAGKQQENKA